LDEVRSISDRITVMKSGKVVSTVKGDEASKSDLARMMVGREVIFQVEKKPAPKGKSVLKLQDVEAFGDKGLLALDHASFEIREGEVFGIAGVSGNGQRELYEVIVGVRRIANGRIWIGEEEVTNASPNRIQRLGFSDIPYDKIREGAILGFSVAENLILGLHRRSPFVQSLLFDHHAIAANAEKLVNEFGIYPPLIQKMAKTLSGGNLQKLVLARELSKGPKLLIASQPTRGLDVAATEFTRRKLLQERERGTAVLLISEDLDEIVSLCDSFGIIFGGRIVSILKPEETSLREIGLLMTTGKCEQE